MKWQIPPHGGKYNLVATFKENENTYLTVITEGGTRCNATGRCRIKTYLISLSEGISYKLKRHIH